MNHQTHTNDMQIELVQRTIERLLQFARKAQLIDRTDEVLMRNTWIDLLQIEEPYSGKVLDETLDSPVELLEILLNHAAAIGILIENTTTNRDLLDARIMGTLTPKSSEVISRFWKIATQNSIQAATDYFYRLCIDVNYIRMNRIQKNELWLSATEYGDLEITINLSKPEKDPKEIALLQSLPQRTYPRCLLCIENVGYSGRLDHPARQNLRVIPLKLDGDDWYFQYSPYVYYPEHCIIFSGEHVPMRITKQTFERILDFVDQIPHYFVGSNADLPVVGGSILNHDHFQGGHHRFPMEMSVAERSFTHTEYTQVRASIVKWPMSVIRLTSHNRIALTQLADRILDMWRAYSDSEVEIFAHTSSPSGLDIPHNTITPIGRNNRRGEYELDLVLRNSRTSEEHPEGIFHPHAHLHHIKRENIGLIEVMGLAVLPGRLQQELAEIAGFLTGVTSIERSNLRGQPQHHLYKHLVWIEELLSNYGTRLSVQQAREALRVEVGNKFLEVLHHAGVYARNSQGQQAFGRFMSHVGFIEI
jgi:UDPglucose--hexose-1-phosphate uridylyltransferase